MGNIESTRTAIVIYSAFTCGIFHSMYAMASWIVWLAYACQIIALIHGPAGQGPVICTTPRRGMRCWYRTLPTSDKLSKDQDLSSEMWLDDVSRRWFESLVMPVVWSMHCNGGIVRCLHAQNKVKLKQGQPSNYRQRFECCGRQLCWPSRRSIVTTSQVK